MRACNDLGYAAAILINNNNEVIIRDYQTEKKNINDIEKDLSDFKPDVLFLSTTNATIFKDIELINSLKNRKRKNRKRPYAV